MYIGLDLGTSGLKGILIGEDQAVLAEATAPLTVQRPAEGWSEQAPSDWISAAETVFDRLAQKGLGAVRGIGLSGHMHGATLLDSGDDVLRPCILWNDTRSHAEAAALDADPQFRRLTGNIVFPGFTAPKLAWVRKHEPQVWDRVAKVLLPKDYLRLWLTGEHVGEMSDAAGTSWLDTGKRDWSDELLRATGLDRLGWSRDLRSRANCVRRWPPVGACRRARSWPGAAATMRPRAWVWAWCGPVRRLSRWAQVECCLRRMTATSLILRQPSTPSATRCPTPGTRWA
jgi:sugar (pentulose or hexulose) kinase